MKHGRNAPCPCGSGKKYKHCCLVKDTQPSRQELASQAPGMALGWLEQHFRKQMGAAVENEFFATIDPAELSAMLAQLDPQLQQMLLINANEWALCETEIERGEDIGRAIAWVLERGPRMDPAQREYLEALADAPLRLYEVTSVRPGEGIELCDLLDSGHEVDFVQEETASQSLREGDVLGLRVIHLPDHAELSGAVYALSRMTALEVMEQVQQALEGSDFEDFDPDTDDETPIDPAVAAAIEAEFAREDSEDELDAIAAIADEFENEIIAGAIRDAWLQALLMPTIPSLLDAASGEPLLLIEDDYEVRDLAALRAVLAEQTDVEENEDGWVRLESRDGDLARVSTAINVTETPDRITLFHRSRSRADTGREWFESLAGESVVHRSRRQTDPHDIVRGGNVAPIGSGDEDSQDVELTDEMRDEIIQRGYADWCDKPVPALAGRTPRQCMASDEGRDKLRYLLRSYEHAEHEQAEYEQRAPVSYEFLWERLGLEHTS